MGNTEIERQHGKGKDSITKILASRQGYEVNHLATVETKKKPGVARALHDVFVEKSELCPAAARRLLRQAGRKTSYVTVQRLFYDLRQIGLIEFTHSEPGKAPIDKRYYRIIPGKEDDPRWDTYPHYELYPSAKLGGLKYEFGTSKGRAKKYAK
jgi:hypothetical protein